MLQERDGGIYEMATVTSNAVSALSVNTTGGVAYGQSSTIGHCFPDYVPTTCYHTVYWNSWPVYICTDKTAKAMEILKRLEADKEIKLTSVKAFIALVEKIAGIL